MVFIMTQYIAVMPTFFMNITILRKTKGTVPADLRQKSKVCGHRSVKLSEKLFDIGTKPDGRLGGADGDITVLLDDGQSYIVVLVIVILCFAVVGVHEIICLVIEVAEEGKLLEIYVGCRFCGICKRDKVSLSYEELL